MIDALLARLNYVVFAVLLALGLFVLIDDDNLLKKVIGLNIFQTAIFLFYLSAGFRTGGSPAILSPGGGPYTNPLPQTLILTAIVVGVSVTAVALALVKRIYGEYGTLREDVLRDVLAGESTATNGADEHVEGRDD